MILWPKRISRDDEQWSKALALMQVLPLDPRGHSYRASGNGQRFYTSAHEFLQRQMVTVNRKVIPAPYFGFALDFSVACRVLGSIPIDDEEQLAEFVRAVDAALAGELTTAEKGLWKAAYERNQVERRLVVTAEVDRDPLRERSEALKATAADLSMISSQHYNAQMTRVLTSREANPMGKRPGHEEVMLALIEQGKQMLAEQDEHFEVDPRLPRETMGG